jgi:hypothetical protein
MSLDDEFLVAIDYFPNRKFVSEDLTVVRRFEPLCLLNTNGITGRNYAHTS